MSNYTLDELSAHIAATTPILQERLVRSWIPAHRKHGCYEGLTDDEVVKLPFCVILSNEIFCAWLNLIPKT